MKWLEDKCRASYEFSLAVAIIGVALMVLIWRA